MFKIFQSIVKNYYRILILFLLVLFLSIGITPVFSQNNSEILTPTDAINLVEESRLLYEKNDYSLAIEKLEKAINFLEKNKEENQENLAISYTNLGRFNLLLGNANEALANWEKATNIYQQLNNDIEISNTLILQAKALSQLGFYPRACDTIIVGLGIETEQKNCQQIEFSKIPNFKEQINNNLAKYNQSYYLQGLVIFGNILSKLGKLEDAKIVFEETLTLLPQNNNSLKAYILLSLGDTFKAQGDIETERQSPPQYNYIPWYCEEKNIPIESQNLYKNAAKYYLQAIDLIPSQDLLIKAQLKQLNLSLTLNDINQSQELIFQINLANLPVNNSNIFTKVNYAKNLACFLQKNSQQTKPNINDYLLIINILNDAIKEAKFINNNLTLSYVLGNLGGLYEYLGDLNQAQKYTEQALYLIQPIQEPSLAYQWQWQLARLLESQGNEEKAIAIYENAVNTLQPVRSDLLNINTNVQFSFRDNVEPLYRNLVNLLVSTNNNNPNQENLWKSIYYFDDIQLAELENFLQCTVDSKLQTAKIYQKLIINKSLEILQKQMEEFFAKNPHTAFIYSLTFQDKVSVILKLPQQPLIYKSKQIQLNELQKIIAQADKNLKQGLFVKGSEKPLNKLYQLLLADLEVYLQKFNIKNLIFVSDNTLRNIPVAALHDGKEFIIENKYAVSVSPTSQILQARNYQTLQFNALIAGSLKSRPNFDTLQLVAEQVNQVNKILPQSEILVDKLGQQFTKESFKKALDSSQYNLVHLVTHGKFSSNPKETYIITDDNSDNFEQYTIKINEFNTYINNKNKTIDLLVLSSCETAEGDKRAVLGMAGVAVKSGANGTIASLWKADQELTGIFMERFYDYFVNQKFSKTEALRLTQKSFLEEKDLLYKSPRNWALFVLVGY